jgi:hypothetical protein
MGLDNRDFGFKAEILLGDADQYICAPKMCVVFTDVAEASF